MTKKVVYKYPVKGITVFIPKGGEILCLKGQYGVPTIWALVDPHETDHEPRHIYSVVTGGEVEPSWKYLGTVLYDNDAFVKHYFEEQR